MGWIRIKEGQGWDGGGHEGYLVPLVSVDEGDGYVRFLEAEQPEAVLVVDAVVDADDVRVQVFQIGCACGWRSRRLYTPLTATCNRHLMELHDAATEDEAQAIWIRHLDEAEIKLARLFPYKGA